MISMGTGRRYLLVSVIAGIFFLVFGSADNAYATTTTLDVANTGMACESLGGVWTAATSTCTFSATLTIAVGDTLTVTKGVTLAFLPNFNLINLGEITNFGTIIITGTSINNGRLENRFGADFTNSGTIIITGDKSNRGQLRNQEDSDFTNSGTITITGTSGSSGQLRNLDSADFTNSGIITIIGTSEKSGQLRNLDAAEFKNSGTITITGTSDNSGLVVNLSVLTNSGSISTNNGFNNNDADSVMVIIPKFVISPLIIKFAFGKNARVTPFVTVRVFPAIIVRRDVSKVHVEVAAVQTPPPFGSPLQDASLERTKSTAYALSIEPKARKKMPAITLTSKYLLPVPIEIIL